MINEFENKKIFVSGGTNGIGYEIVKNFLAKKAKIYVLGRKNKFKKEKNLVVLNYDILKDKYLKKLIAKIKTIDFDIVIHSLGGSLKLDNFNDLDKTVKIWKLNAGIPILLNEYFLKKMKKKKFGRVVHISSASTENLDGRLPYICSKTYLNSYVKKKSLEVGKFDILINAILPGAISAYKNNLYEFVKKKENKKRFIKRYLKVNKIGTTDSLMPLLEFLVSKKNNYIIGELIKIDGGER